MRNQRGATFVVLYAVLAVLGLMLWTCTAFSQSISYGVVIGPARDTMVAAWQTKVEAGYCVAADTVFQMDSASGLEHDTLYVVGRVVRAHTFVATHDSVEYECPDGLASVHTHPGMDVPHVSDCNPSRYDWLALDKSRARYNVIQCAPTAFVFFFESMNPLAKHPHRTIFYAPEKKP